MTQTSGNFIASCLQLQKNPLDRTGHKGVLGLDYSTLAAAKSMTGLEGAAMADL